jgi:hypothetical protein
MAKLAREQMYYVIVMPLNADGQGPASIEKGEARKLTWEVWDQAFMSYSSHDFLPDAIDDCNARNEEHERLLKS